MRLASNNLLDAAVITNDKTMKEQKQYEQFEIYYQISGGDFFFSGSQKVKSDYHNEEKLTTVFRQHLAKRFPIDSIQVTSIRQLPISPESV
jgi:hypothetical protein